MQINVKVILEGVAIILVAGILMGGVKLNSAVAQNTEHRIIDSPKIDEMHGIIIEVRNNQKWIMKQLED